MQAQTALAKPRRRIVPHPIGGIWDILGLQGTWGAFLLFSGSANLSVAALKSITPIHIGAQTMGVGAANALAATDLLADPGAPTFLRN
jgi:hypothetical protein